MRKSKLAEYKYVVRWTEYHYETTVVVSKMFKDFDEALRRAVEKNGTVHEVGPAMYPKIGWSWEK